nr:hypothetical protein [Tanacetum cinerariifolium]
MVGYQDAERSYCETRLSVRDLQHLASEPRTKDHAFCQDPAFCYKRSCILSRSCVLLQKILRFVKILHFATKDPAFCQDPAFCYKRSCVLSRSCVLLEKILRFATKDPAFCQDPAFCYKRSCGLSSTLSWWDTKMLKEAIVRQGLGVKVVKKVAKSDLDSDLSIRLRFGGKKSDFEQDSWFVRRCVLLKLFLVAFCLCCSSLRFGGRQKIMRFVKILRFATKDPAVCQDPAFCYKRSCVLSRSYVLLQKILRFVKILRFARKDPAFCYKRSCVLSRSCVLLQKIMRPNGEALRKCILSGPYKPITVLVHAIEATDDSPVVPEHTTVETPTNMSPENKAHFLEEKEAIHLILIGIRDDIYSTVDACQTVQEMWGAIQRLQQ